MPGRMEGQKDERKKLDVGKTGRMEGQKDGRMDD